MVSIHALLAECDIKSNGASGRTSGFNPRTPCGVRLFPTRNPVTSYLVSIHALLAECDSAPSNQGSLGTGFNPRTPCGVRLVQAPWVRSFLEVSIHALLAECDGLVDSAGVFNGVSIHALLAECDPPVSPVSPDAIGFNPRTPCGVRLSMIVSTFPVRGFNPRTPCGVRLLASFGFKLFHVVSIHALLAECDYAARRAFNIADVSIHALLAECDVRNIPFPVRKGMFQSTHSLRSATSPYRGNCHPS